MCLKPGFALSSRIVNLLVAKVSDADRKADANVVSDSKSKKLPALGRSRLLPSVRQRDHVPDLFSRASSLEGLGCPSLSLAASVAFHGLRVTAAIVVHVSHANHTKIPATV